MIYDLQTAYSLQFTVYNLLLTTYYLQPKTYYLQPTTYNPQLTMDSSERSFLGRGWSFPPTFSKQTSQVLMTSNEEDINKSLEILLSTTIGERFLQPLYGCNLEDYVFEALSASTQTSIKITVTNAILIFEPRIRLLTVELLKDFISEGRIDIYVDYEVIITNTRFNLVYPFYINEANNKSA